MNFCKSVKQEKPEYFKNVSVLDVGCMDINGNNRYLFESFNYLGIDLGKGKNVDVVCPGHFFKTDKKFDVVISTECFEHDKFWKQTIINIVENLLRPGGMFIFSCATTGRAEHGTTRTSPIDSPFTNDYYMNLTEADIRQAINVDDLFSEYKFFSRTTWPADLYFYGILKDV